MRQIRKRKKWWHWSTKFLWRHLYFLTDAAAVSSLMLVEYSQSFWPAFSSCSQFHQHLNRHFYNNKLQSQAVSREKAPTNTFVQESWFLMLVKLIPGLDAPSRKPRPTRIEPRSHNRLKIINIYILKISFDLISDDKSWKFTKLLKQICKIFCILRLLRLKVVFEADIIKRWC
jgi:hypothetical protein